MSYIRKELRLTKSADKDLMKALRDETHHLDKALAAMGARYVSRGAGKGGLPVEEFNVKKGVGNYHLL